MSDTGITIREQALILMMKVAGRYLTKDEVEENIGLVETMIEQRWYLGAYMAIMIGGYENGKSIRHQYKDS